MYEKKYNSSGYFNNLAFYNDFQSVVPLHTKVWRADVGSMKGASSNVEIVFSGVKRLLGDFAATMSPEILELYVFIHYKWQYDFMQPSIHMIVKTYLEVYTDQPTEGDLYFSDDEFEEEDEEEEEAPE